MGGKDERFENVFLADWNNKAKPVVAKGAVKPKAKPKAKA